jgi:hypothetical protein
MTLDAKLQWKEEGRSDELIKFRKMYWLLERSFELSVHNKLIYKKVKRSVWSSGIEPWGCASDSNIEVIHRYQNEVHHGTFEIVTITVISGSRRLKISLLISPSLMKRCFKTNQYKNVQNSQREQYHQTTQTEETS